MESEIESSSVIESLKDTVSKLNKGSEHSQLKVKIYYFDDDEDVTQIMFSVVNTDGEIEESESVIINELLNIDDLSAMIRFFMNNNDFISKYGFDDYGVSFAFGNNIIPIHNTINFSKVVLRVDFDCVKDKQIIFDYLRTILISFKEELSETRYFAQKYKQYCEDLKYDYIASATGEEMADTIISLNTDEITSIIKMIPSERLIEVLNAKHSRQLKRKRVKEEE